MTPAEIPSVFELLIPFFMVFIIYYYLNIYPEYKKEKEKKILIKSLKYGDFVVTVDGTLGAVIEVTDETVMLEIANSVKIMISKDQIMIPNRKSFLRQFYATVLNLNNKSDSKRL
jgi:preprotein translocase subunit YajC